jgi:hypothetical protein
MHHIISDRWSMDVFFRELVMCYRAFCEGRPTPLRDLPIQSVDFALWEKGLLEKGLLDDQINYWKKQLAGPLPQIKFDQGIDQTNKLSFQTSRAVIEFTEELFAGVKRFAQRENCTTFMVLHAAFAILLYQYTGQQDIRIGTMVANRGRQEAEGVIGHFVNTVILRTQISPELTVRNFLEKVRDTILGACANQELPFEKLMQILEDEGCIDRTALIPALINYQRFGSEADSVCGLSFAPLGWQQPSGLEKVMFTTFDLVLNLRETTTALTASVTLKTAAFSAVIMSEPIDRFQNILAIMIAEPDHRISQHWN